jgi:predicted adenine nucleotide alpha hydrolase (AANH) superfamily ATPase
MTEKLLLHTCCAPCLSGTYPQVDDYVVYIFWYNPNIEPKAEHDKRYEALQSYLARCNLPLMANYNYNLENKEWHDYVKDLEDEPEGGKRCQKCFRFRLRKSAELAQKINALFSTTLSISPYKNYQIIKEVAVEASKATGALFLDRNFSNSFGLSIELSKKFGLYRQKYCGCQYSIRY